MTTLTAPGPPPLWPQPVPVIGLTGDFGSGKSLFVLLISPGSGTLVYDFEKSTESYQQLGFKRIDVYEEMLKHLPSGYKGPQLWEWWRDHVRAIRPGQYRVIGLDPVSELEGALGDWVMEHARDFGRTRSQYVNNYGQPTGLFWGDVKTVWKAALNDLAARCECFAFTAHMSTVYVNNAPTNRKKPKGKETLFELASLYLEMERKADLQGNQPAIPSAKVRKQRLLHLTVDPASGELKPTPALPPRLPQATAAEIRRYMATPPNYANLAPEERAPEVGMSDDERAELRARTAEAEAEAERLRVEQMDRRERALGSRSAPTAEVAVRAPSPAAEATAPAPVPSASPNQPRAQDVTGRATALPLDESGAIWPTQLERLGELRQELFDRASEPDPDGAWAAILGRRNVTSARELTSAQAEELIAVLCGAIAQLDREEPAASEGPEGGGGPARESFPPAE